MAITFKSVLIDNNSSSGGGNGLNVSVETQAMFAGQTITCSDGVTTLTSSFPNSSPYRVIFTVPNGGTWTLSCTLNEQLFTHQFSIESSIGFYLYDGSTVNPTNDISIWLACGSATDKQYTTLSQLLQDSETVDKLMSSSNAVNYLVRSTTWATTICADEAAMISIGNNSYCVDTLLNNNTWYQAISDSQYYDAILQPLIPVMTSNTEPSGQVSASNTYGSHVAAYKAFRNAIYSDGWGSIGNESNYISYTFPEAVKPYKLRVYNNQTGNFNFHMSKFSLQASVDGSLYITLIGNTYYSNGVDTFIDIQNPAYYRFFKLNVDGTNAYAGLQLMQLYGRTSST